MQFLKDNIKWSETVNKNNIMLAFLKILNIGIYVPKFGIFIHCKNDSPQT